MIYTLEDKINVLIELEEDFGQNRSLGNVRNNLEAQLKGRNAKGM